MKQLLSLGADILSCFQWQVCFRHVSPLTLHDRMLSARPETQHAPPHFNVPVYFSGDTLARQGLARVISEHSLIAPYGVVLRVEQL